MATTWAIALTAAVVLSLILRLRDGIGALLPYLLGEDEGSEQGSS